MKTFYKKHFLWRKLPLIACVGFPLRSNLEFGKPPIRRRASPYLQNKQEKSLNDESLEMNVAISRKKLSRKYAIQRCTGNGNVQIRNSGNFQFEGELRHSCKINTNLVWFYRYIQTKSPDKHQGQGLFHSWYLLCTVITK